MSKRTWQEGLVTEPKETGDKMNKTVTMSQIDNLVEEAIVLIEGGDEEALEEKLVVLAYRVDKEDVEAMLELAILVKVATEMKKEGA